MARTTVPKSVSSPATGAGHYGMLKFMQWVEGRICIGGVPVLRYSVRALDVPRWIPDRTS